MARMITLGSILLTQVLGCTAQGAESTDAALSAAAFSQARLLERFDDDRDGALSRTESVNVRAAFGDVDVPMLVAGYRYTDVNTPDSRWAQQLRDSDNTPDDNLLTDRGAALGRVLFYDKQLSANNTIACASCHLQHLAFSDPQPQSVGFRGGKTGRNAMSLVNLRFTNINGSHPGFFWDERAATLEDQALMPIQDPIEMGMPLRDLEMKLQQLPYYPVLFEAAFGDPQVTSDRIAKAFAQFIRSMVSFNSKFDRELAAAQHGESQEFGGFTSEENLGKSLFIDGVGGVAEIGCAHCHIPPTFNMPKSFNNGLDLKSEDRGLGARNVPPNDPFTPSNDGKFKASSLRNVALTAPYMHDGRFQTLEQVVRHYSQGVRPHENLGLAFNEDGQPDSNIDGVMGFGLTAAQQSALVAFLKTLTDDSFITDPKFSDPFVRLNE